MMTVKINGLLQRSSSYCFHHDCHEHLFQEGRWCKHSIFTKLQWCSDLEANMRYFPQVIMHFKFKRSYLSFCNTLSKSTRNLWYIQVMRPQGGKLRVESTSGHHPVQPHKAESAKTGCPGPCSVGFWMSLSMETSQPLWAIYSSVQPPSWKKKV